MRKALERMLRQTYLLERDVFRLEIHPTEEKNNVV